MITLPMLTLWGACTNTVRFPPDLWGGETWTDSWWETADTGFVDNPGNPGPTGALEVARVFGGCSGADMAFSVITTAWAERSDLHLWRTAPGLQEAHNMTLTDLDPNGTWDRWDITLAGGSPFVPGSASAADCDADILSFALVLFDEDPDLPTRDRPADCVVWGPDSAALVQQLVLDDPELSTLTCTPVTL